MLKPFIWRSHAPAFGALRAFEAAARLGSLSEAANELHVTKSAISHQLRGLEENLGMPLLLRGGSLRRAEVTKEGARLLHAVQQAMAMLETACNSIRRAAHKAAPHALNLSASQSVTSLWLTHSMHRFVEENSDISLQVHQHTNQKPAWKTQDIDLAIIHIRDDGPHRSQEGDIPLFEESIVPVCGAGLVVAGREKDPGFIAENRWIEERHVSSPETAWELWSRRLGLDTHGSSGLTVLSGLGTVVSAVAAGAGVGLGRLPVINEEIARGRLVALVPESCMRGSWRYVIRIRPGRVVDEPLSRLIQFVQDDAKRLVGLAGIAPTA